MSSPCECCKALWVKFELTAPLTRSTEKAAAKVYVDDAGHRYYWQGDDPDPDYDDPEDSGFDVYNLEARQPFGDEPPYQFFGVKGDIGLACLDDSDPKQSRYRIVHLPPPRVALILEPIDPIPPAEHYMPYGEVQMGSGECWVLKRNSLSGTLDYVKDSEGEREVVVAWNLCSKTVGEESGGFGGSGDSSIGCTLVYAVEDKFGDLVITEVFDYECGSSSSSYSFSSSSSHSSGSSESSESSNSSEHSSESSEHSSHSGSESHSQSHHSSTSHPSHGSESDKSTAIVPATWSPTGYTALFVAEMPEVRFDDVMEVCTNRAVTEVPIDPKYVEVCEPNSIRVCGAVPNLPVFVGASVSRGTLVIRLDKPSDEKVTISVRLTGIRRGFENKRFPNRSREQFEANERFIRSAYPGD